MTSDLIRFLLVLIGLTICLSNGIYGEDVENKEVLSTPVKNDLNKLAEDAVISNTVKREALPDATVEKKTNRRGKKKESLKKRKRKNHQRNKKGARKNKQRNKKKSLKNRNKKNKQGSRKGKNRRAKKKHSLKRRTKNRQGNKKGKRKNSQVNKKEGLNKPKMISKQTGNCIDCTKTISTSIKTYKKYLNHKRLISRIFKWQSIIEKKSHKLEQYSQAKASLEKVTWNDGTYCPGNTSYNGELIEVLENLTKCANKPDGSITKFCNLTLIKNLETLNNSVELCLENPSGLPYNTYTKWINGFDNCSTASSPDCGCYGSINTDDNVSNKPPYSCKNPNSNGTDWIIEFKKDTYKVLQECNKAIKGCKAVETKACGLTSICCEKSKNETAVTKAGRGRRMQIKASMLKKFQNMNIF